MRSHRTYRRRRARDRRRAFRAGIVDALCTKTNRYFARMDDADAYERGVALARGPIVATLTVVIMFTAIYAIWMVLP